MVADKPDTMAMAASFLLHLLVIAAISVQFAFFKAKPLELEQSIPIDIEEQGAVTTTQKQGVGNTAKLTPAQARAKLPTPPPQATQPQRPAPNPVKPVKAAAQPEADFGDVMSQLTKTPPTPKKAEAQPENFNSLLKNLSQDKPQPKVDQSTPNAPATKASDAGSKGLLSDKLTISEEDALRRQIEQCWNVPTGARGIQDMVVTIHVVMNRDRTVKTAEIVQTSTSLSDPFYRSVAESALRAVLNPKCSPFQLPDDKYDLWNDITMSFNPKDVV